MSFKYIGYDLLNDTLIATNSESEWRLTIGHTPQICKYFKTLNEAMEWINTNLYAHEEFLKEREKEYQFYISEYNDIRFSVDSLEYLEGQAAAQLNLAFEQAQEDYELPPHNDEEITFDESSAF